MCRSASIFIALTLLASTGLAQPTADAAGASQQPEGGATRNLSLQEAYRLALSNNPTLAQLEARISAAAAETRRAWTRLQPNARIQGTFTHSQPEIVVDPSIFAPPDAEPSEPIVIQKENQFGFQIEASLPVFRAPAYQQIGVARKGRRAAELRLARARQTYPLRVADAYYGALSLREVVTALDEKVAVDRRNLAAARARLEVGQVTRSDVLRAELELVQDEQQRLQQANALSAAKRRVAILVGIPGSIELEEPGEPASPLGDANRLVGAALRGRADLAALRLDIASARQAERAAWWGFMPFLDLNFLYRWQEAAGFAGQQDSWSLVAALTLPVWEAGVRLADIDSARAQINQAMAVEAELARDIAERITQLQADLASAEAGLVSARKAVSLAEVTAEEMAARYASGTATQLDLLDATQRLLQARIDLSRSRYDRDLARLALASEVGQFKPGAAPR